MADSKLVLSKCFHILGLERPNMDDFNDRLRLQKIVYLLWGYGIHLGYGFNWYVHGPYSPKLADDGYAIDDDIFEDGRDIILNDEHRVIESLNNFKEVVGEDHFKDPLYLEILASLHYIKKVAFGGRGDFEEISDWLISRKPYLKKQPHDTPIQELMTSAYEKLSEFEN